MTVETKWACEGPSSARSLGSRRCPNLLGGARLIAVVAMVGLVGCDTPVGRLFDSGLRFTLSYEHAHGLQAEAPVAYKGLTIGQVREVRLDPSGAVLADVRIEAKFKDSVYREADYVIEPGPDGRRLVALKDVDGPRTPVQPGEVVRGREALGDQAGRLLDRFGREAMRAVQTAGSQMGQALDQAVQEAGREFDRAGEELRRAQREAEEARQRALREQPPPATGLTPSPRPPTRAAPKPPQPAPGR